ncbi:MAG: NAD(P)-dependent oxidoreductase [Actinomycetota bacterium]
MSSRVVEPGRTAIGFVGLGNMGRPMAGHLVAAGYEVRVYDVAPEPVADLVARGATAVAEVAEAAKADVLITMLPGPTQIAQVMLEGGAAEAMAPGAVWIDMSTSVPQAAEVAVARLAAIGARAVDAPVSGMAHGARAATLQIFAGGDDDVVAEVRPLFEVLGDPDRILHVGGKGTGYTVKLLINQLWFAHLVATAEILSIGANAGVDLAVLRRSLLASPAASNFLAADVDRILSDGDYDESFALALACKDSGLAVDLARHTGSPSELLGLVDQVFQRARRHYGDDAGEMRPFQLYEDLVGRPLRYGHAPVAAE